MKLPALLAFTAFASSAAAQYFSEGWKPGQPISKASTTSTGYSPSATETPVSRSSKSLFDLTTYLESGPLKALFDRTGVNITEKLEAARQQTQIWDERVPFMTDSNYAELIVNESLTPEEEKDRVWFLVITITSAQPEGISKFVDQQFDQAFNLTQIAGDLPHVRWGRIDYMNVTALTTKWAVWRAPFLVVLKDRGQTLRFYRAHQIRLNAEVLREFLRVDGWEQTEPWSTAFAPGGSREFILDWLATGLTKIYDITVLVPKWALLLITGSFASLVINFLHTGKKQVADSKLSDGTAVVAQPPASSSSGEANVAKGNGVKQRKGGKK